MLYARTNTQSDLHFCHHKVTISPCGATCESCSVCLTPVSRLRTVTCCHGNLVWRRMQRCHFHEQLCVTKFTNTPEITLTQTSHSVFWLHFDVVHNGCARYRGDQNSFVKVFRVWTFLRLYQLCLSAQLLHRIYWLIMQAIQLTNMNTFVLVVVLVLNEVSYQT